MHYTYREPPKSELIARLGKHMDRARHLGWTIWDPLDLIGSRESIEDEYDDYLCQAIRMLRDGTSVVFVARYLERAERRTMCGCQPNTARRAQRLAAALVPIGRRRQ